MRKDYEKFTPTPNPRQKEETPDDELSYSKNFLEFDKQLLVWGRAHLEPLEPPTGLFDRIIFAIKREQELRHTKRLLFGFLSLLLISLVATPLFGAMLINQAASSGISYFISAAINDLRTFFALWQDFGLAILESLPIGGIVSFFLSLAVSVFTLRLFLHRRKLLFGYLMQSFA